MRTLLVSLISPFDGSFGAQQRTLMLYKALTQIGEVDIVLIRPSNAFSVTPGKHPIKAEVTWRPNPLGLGRLRIDKEIMKGLQEYLDFKAYDLVVGRYISALSKLDIPVDLPVIVDLDDVYYRFSGHFYSDPAHFLSRIKAWLKKLAVNSALNKYAGGFFVSAKDRRSLPNFPGVLLPNIPSEYNPSPNWQTDSRRILFVGSLWYGPNKEGINRFLQHSWNEVHADIPDAELILAGPASTEQIEAWNKIPGVAALGFVDNLHALYENSAFTIAPIYYGGGTNIKVLESLALGRACITTPFCASSFGNLFNPATSLCIAEDDMEMTANCKRLLNDSNEREARAKTGHEVVMKKFNEDEFNKIVSSYIHTILK